MATPAVTKHDMALHPLHFRGRAIKQAIVNLILDSLDKALYRPFSVLVLLLFDIHGG